MLSVQQKCRSPSLVARRATKDSLGGATSGQVIQVYFGDWVSPVAEGAELWAWKGRILFLIEKWEHMLHKLAQSVIRGLVSFGPFLY